MKLSKLSLSVKLFLILTVLVLGFFTWKSFFKKPTEQITNLDNPEQIDINLFVKDWNTDLNQANKKYYGKVIQITGRVYLSDFSTVSGKFFASLQGNDPE